MEISGIERRKHIRFQFKYSVNHRLEGTTEWLTSASDNLSLGGMMFISQKLYSYGDALDIQICFSEEPRVVSGITIPATVIWVTKMPEDPNHFLTGLKFRSLSPEHENHINSMVQHSSRILNEKKVSKKKKILVVEDEATLKELIAVCLTQKSYDVATADTGKAAISLYKTYRPDLLILDINLPDILGIEIAEVIKTLKTEYTPPKVIIMTAISYGVNDARERWMKEYDFVVDFIKKPFKYQELLNKIEDNLK